jgi:hypothetical protein
VSDAASEHLRVTSRPVALRPWMIALGLACLAAFVLTGILLPRDDDGVAFGRPDQIAYFCFGAGLAAAAYLPLRPRVIADAAGIRVRGVFGPEKSVPWDLVRAVEFRPGWRWARLLLPADETISLYAVMRMDGERSVAVMRGLRELHAAATPAANV